MEVGRRRRVRRLLLGAFVLCIDTLTVIENILPTAVNECAPQFFRMSKRGSGIEAVGLQSMANCWLAEHGQHSMCRFRFRIHSLQSIAISAHIRMFVLDIHVMGMEPYGSWTARARPGKSTTITLLEPKKHWISRQHVAIHPPIHPSTHLSIYLYLSPFIHLPIYVSIFLFIHLSIQHLSNYLFRINQVNARPAIQPPIHLSIYPRLTGWTPATHPRRGPSAPATHPRRGRRIRNLLMFQYELALFNTI